MTDLTLTEMMNDLHQHTAIKSLQMKLQNLITEIRLTCEEHDFCTCEQMLDKMEELIQEYFFQDQISCSDCEIIKNEINQLKNNINDIYSNPSHSRLSCTKKISTQEQAIFDLLNQIEMIILNLKDTCYMVK